MSITRLKQRFYGLQDSNDLLLKRAGKEAIHELGYVFGLRHVNLAVNRLHHFPSIVQIIFQFIPFNN
ncbi:MAG: hypothetical protein NWF08_00915 [Candidatus Bathyarchaeota archaeon]|nr:hypothetical protein [Candidatus Bathyarchaeota archaeon]